MGNFKVNNHLNTSRLISLFPAEAQGIRSKVRMQKPYLSREYAKSQNRLLVVLHVMWCEYIFIMPMNGSA